MAEFPDSLFLRLQGQGWCCQNEVDLLRRWRAAARATAPLAEVQDPLRFLPGKCDRALWESSQLDVSWQVRSHSARPANWTWLEYISAGGAVSGSAIATALDEIYLEAATIADRCRLRTKSSIVQGPFTFSERCQQSDCAFLDIVHALDEGGQEADCSDLAIMGPRAKIARLTEDMSGATGRGNWHPMAWRFAGHLAEERSRRLAAASIKGSWRCVKSGLMAWTAFHAGPLLGRQAEFPVTMHNLAAFSAAFDNGCTLAQYISHLRFATRWLRCSSQFPHSSEVSALLRGCRKITTHRTKVALQADQVRVLVRRLVAEGLLETARVVVVARDFMLRVQSELGPLQLDGRPPRWHSRVVFDCDRVRLILASRKNAPDGAEIVRRCTCARSPRKMLLCGVCCIRALVRDARARGVAPDDLILSGGLSVHLARVQRYAEVLCLPRPSWHSFRRGAARDMLKRGCTLAQLLEAGGWRSSAFLQYLSRRDIDARTGIELALIDSDSE